MRIGCILCNGGFSPQADNLNKESINSQTVQQRRHHREFTNVATADGVDQACRKAPVNGTADTLQDRYQTSLHPESDHWLHGWRRPG